MVQLNSLVYEYITQYVFSSNWFCLNKKQSLSRWQKNVYHLVARHQSKAWIHCADCWNVICNLRWNINLKHKQTFWSNFFYNESMCSAFTESVSHEIMDSEDGENGCDWDVVTDSLWPTDTAHQLINIHQPIVKRGQRECCCPAAPRVRTSTKWLQNSRPLYGLWMEWNTTAHRLIDDLLNQATYLCAPPKGLWFVWANSQRNYGIPQNMAF